MLQAAKRVPFMTADEVVKMQGQEGITFVDVREPPEWVETGIVVGALPVRAVYRD
jgi:rhodanese-related sulfurtransferase